jgi:ABC-type Fe3+/spermidine/putrescine transport system ATPase subunit
MSTVADVAAGDAPILRVTDLRKTFAVDKKQGNSVYALDGISFDVQPGEFFTLLGPSGCGKTTTLRSIAGLEQPDAGEIVVSDRVLFSSKSKIDVPANRRELGMVFQSYAIWPHMDVFSNVAFPLRSVPRRERLSRIKIEQKVDAALETVQLIHARKRRATDLSGGQQQRLALARALVTESPLTLFDEPLSNLDAKLRDGMRFELKRLQRELGLTAIYVTHDQIEALAMSSRIAVMREGTVEQLATPREVYETPATPFVADFIGVSNFFDGKIIAQQPGEIYHVETAAGVLECSVTGEDVSIANGTEVTVAVRPQHVRLAKEPDAVRDIGIWPGIVRTRAYMGEYLDHMVEVGDVMVRVRGDARVSIAPGVEVSVSFDTAHCAVLPRR